MTITLDDPEVEQALHELSRETGESLSRAAEVAVRERLARVRATLSGERERSLRALVELIEEAGGSPVLDARPNKSISDELWGDE